MFVNELKVGNTYSVRDRHGCVSFDAIFLGLAQNYLGKELLLFECIRGQTDPTYYRYCGVEPRSHFRYRKNELVTQLRVVRYGHDEHLKNSEYDENYWTLLK